MLPLKILFGKIGLIFKAHPRFWTTFFTLIFFFWVVIYASWLIEPKAPVQNILISNLSEKSASISWTTSIPTRGTILVSDNSKFPLLPTFANNLQKDDSDKIAHKTGYYTSHHVSVEGLKPAKKYDFRIYQGQKKVFEGSFITAPTLNSLTNPNPVYGKVVTEDKKPVARAIVYFRVAAKDATPSAILSTVTNSEGGWNVDLANLRTQDLRGRPSLTNKTQELVIVEAGNLGRVKAGTLAGNDKPWPTIIVKRK